MQVVAPEAVGISAERLNNIKARLQEYVDAGKVAGFVTLVARESDVAHFETCGYRDAENKRPMEGDTIFRIYSMTKPITSIALMQLYERGKFQLSEPVSRYIPAFGKTKVLSGVGYLGQQLVPQNPPMTIHHLLTHTAGLSYGFFLDTPIDEMYRNSIFRSENRHAGREGRGHGGTAAALPAGQRLELQRRHRRLRLSCASFGGYAL